MLETVDWPMWTSNELPLNYMYAIMKIDVSLPGSDAPNKSLGVTGKLALSGVHNTPYKQSSKYCFQNFHVIHVFRNKVRR